MRASALIPRLYRAKFGRDLITDMRRLQGKYMKIAELPADADEETRAAAELSVMDLTVFEDIAWLMIKRAGETIPDTPDEWLDSIDGVFDIYRIMPTVLELWQANNATTAIPKKK